MDLRFAMLKGRGMRAFVYWCIVMLVVVVDQVTKEVAIQVLADGPRDLIPHVIGLVHVENTGAAFSMLQGASLLFVVIAVAFVGAATYFVWTEDGLPYTLVTSVGLVAGGGLGNLIDRVMNGSVTDFIRLTFIDFPVFNIADICVTLGVIYTVVAYWRFDARRESEVELVGGDEASNA